LAALTIVAALYEQGSCECANETIRSSTPSVLGRVEAPAVQRLEAQADRVLRLTSFSSRAPTPRAGPSGDLRRRVPPM